jgi:hypothetical protein
VTRSRLGVAFAVMAVILLGLAANCGPDAPPASVPGPPTYPPTSSSATTPPTAAPTSQPAAPEAEPTRLRPVAPPPTADGDDDRADASQRSDQWERTGQSGHPCRAGERDGDGDGYCGEGR